ncbi:dephospho-CoA kinase [Coprococcus sp. NSJ-10]|uniref:Dephospho-CoA kinase n=1 Tax=Coprococcus hominis (ex Liu et al. 2022) TaxID=2763039 RepID=A0A8I0AP16_9FIRM|nr:dephospho-CoA kinase [Coprococcus hominis (ex Liu et al. 2022)]MBC5662405.1 dephospho-CoA kinase [Coprococcus hominis (ex Liu et al. 2022)]
MMRNKDEMLILGLTGGIGCGKTAVLTILKEEYDAYIIEADRLAHELMEPGKTVYQGIVDAFGMEVLMDADIDISAPAEGNAVTDNGQSTVNRPIDRKKLGDIVFHDKDKLALLNSISHPLVKEEIVRRIEEQKDVGKKLFVIEAALLIQDGYKSICDKMCYVYADLDVRISRLCKYRGFTQERAQAVIDSQESEAFYLEACDYKIDNSGSLENTKKDLKHILDECRI